MSPAKHAQGKSWMDAQIVASNVASDVASLAEAVAGPMASLQLLACRAVAEYAPIVASIVRSGSRDVAQIERTLDGLLDCCFDADALLLYKQLCRHYLPIAPEATVSYVYAYRELWDEDGEERV